MSRRCGQHPGSRACHPPWQRSRLGCHRPYCCHGQVCRRICCGHTRRRASSRCYSALLRSRRRTRVMTGGYVVILARCQSLLSWGPARRVSPSPQRPARSPLPDCRRRAWCWSTVEVAGNWSGRHGYTSGLLPLGTPPEKDVGYPYAASWGGASADVVAAMARYSWQRHLIRLGAYSDWVDRGRMRPTHREWSAYLREVAETAEANIVSGVVTGLEVADGNRWQVRLAAGAEIAADGLVITGAGTAITVPGQPRDLPRVLDGRTYWLAAHKLHHERAQNVCVIGSGETAASVVIDLVKRFHRHSTIDVLTARGVLYSRGESYDENRFYSDPADWPRLAETHRREFLGRTDRGVFSLQAEATLNQARGFRALAGRAVAIEAREQD